MQKVLKLLDKVNSWLEYNNRGIEILGYVFMIYGSFVLLGVYCK